MSTWPGGITAITVFAEDLEGAKEFYRRVFRLPVHWEDENSAVFLFNSTMINLLRVSEAPELIAPARVGGPDAGARLQMTLTVPDVDAAVEELKALGVEFLNGPMDRPWGIRTAAFADPTGLIWEIAN